MDGLHGEQERAVEGGLVERECGDVPCLVGLRTLDCEVCLDPGEDAGCDSEDRESGCAGRYPGQSAHHPALFAQLSLRGGKSCALMRCGGVQEISLDLGECGAGRIPPVQGGVEPAAAVELAVGPSHRVPGG